MTFEQRQAFLDAGQGTRYRGLFEVLVRTGLRPSEAYALRPERALSPGAERTTKTGETREVDLSPELTELLERYLNWLREEAFRLG